MKINGSLCVIEGRHNGASPNRNGIAFTDADGTRIFIQAATLIGLYELLMFDAKRVGYHQGMMNDVAAMYGESTNPIKKV